MLIYEKKVEENNEMVRHLFGTEGHIPSDEDVQLTYKDAEGSEVSGLTVDSKLLDDGHGGIKTEDGEVVNVWLGDVNIIPGDIEPPIPEPTLESISVSTKPTKLTYTTGETLDLTGMVVEGTYSDSSTKTITEYTASPANGATLSEAGDITVTITAESKTDTFQVTVTAANPAPEQTPAEPGE